MGVILSRLREGFIWENEFSVLEELSAAETVNDCNNVPFGDVWIFSLFCGQWSCSSPSIANSCKKSPFLMF